MEGLVTLVVQGLILYVIISYVVMFVVWAYFFLKEERANRKHYPDPSDRKDRAYLAAGLLIVWFPSPLFFAILIFVIVENYWPRGGSISNSPLCPTV